MESMENYVAFLHGFYVCVHLKNEKNICVHPNFDIMNDLVRTLLLTI